MKRIFLTGASGFLGGNFCHLFAGKYEIFAVYNTHEIQNKNVHSHQLDVTKSAKLKTFFNKIKPDAVVHLAAISDPNQCQLNPSVSEVINVEVPENLAHLCAEYQIPFLFASSDLVFDGKSAPYRESDIPAPISIYGLHKAVAEQSVMDIYPQSTICRLPLMYGRTFTENRSVLQPMLTNLDSGLPLMLFTDESRTIASAHDICEGLLRCLGHQGEIFNLGGDERMSRYDFGLEVCKVFGYDKGLLIKSKQKDVGMPAPRPKDVSMSNTKAKEIGWKPASVQSGLERIKKELESKTI